MHISHKIARNDEWERVKTEREWYEVRTTDDNCMFVEIGSGLDDLQHLCVYDNSMEGSLCVCSKLFL